MNLRKTYDPNSLKTDPVKGTQQLPKVLRMIYQLLWLDQQVLQNPKIGCGQTTLSTLSVFAALLELPN